MRLAAKVDSNQNAIVAGLKRAGCEVLSLARVGQGCPDLLVSRARDLWLMEVKTDGGVLNDAQIAFAKRWPVHVVRSVEAALAVVGLLTRDDKRKGRAAAFQAEERGVRLSRPAPVLFGVAEPKKCGRRL